MPGFIASMTNAKTGETKKSEVDDLEAAKIRARTLRGMEKFEEQEGCTCMVTCPDKTVWRMDPPQPGKPIKWKKDKK